MQLIQFHLILTNRSLIFLNHSQSQFISCIYVIIAHCLSIPPSKINKTQYLSHIYQYSCICKIFSQFFFFSFFQNNYIFHYNYIDILHVMLPNLQLKFFFIFFVIENFKRILICRFVIGNIIVYRIIIILNILNKIVVCIELRVVKNFLIQLKVNKLMLLKYYICFFQSI